MVEAEGAMPAGSVTVVNIAAWRSRARELAQLLLAATNRPEDNRFIRDPGGGPAAESEIALVADPTYWSTDLRALTEALSGPSDRPADRPSLAAGAAPAGVERLTLTVEEAAVILGISRAGAYEAVQRGEIPSIRIGRRILVPKAQLSRMLGDDSTDESATT